MADEPDKPGPAKESQQPAADELQRRRFERHVNSIAKTMTDLDETITTLNRNAHTLYTLLTVVLDDIERLHGETAEIKRLRTELEQTHKIFADPLVLPAIEAGLQTFGDIAEQIAKMVGSLK